MPGPQGKIQGIITPIAAFVAALLPVTIGNLIGGTVLVYWSIYL